MPRHKAPAQQVPPKKKRTFFSATKLPALPLARAPSPPRAVSSDRILAALQPDAHVVVAAKNFVKDKMGDDKWEIADKTRVTRGAAAAAAVQPVMKRRGRPPRKAPVAKVQAKVVAVGSTSNVVAQRLKAKTAVVARKITLRTRVPTPPTAAPETIDQEPVAGPSTSRAPVPAPAATPAVAGPSAAMLKEDSSIRSTPPEQSPNKRKDYMTAGLYCDEEQPTEEGILVNRVLAIRSQSAKRGPGRPRKSAAAAAAAAPLAASMPPAEQVSFPPLPIDHGNVHFFGTQREFRLPYDIMWESEQGALDGKRRPPAYTKLRSNKYLERPPCPTTEPGECDCEPDEGCTERCINRIMSYLCGKDCPCGENCGNQSLVRRKGKGTKVFWTGDKARGYGLYATEDISAGEFVIDYRGEVIHINTFIERIETIYRSRKNYYALAYDGNEVLDAGLRGNDARFINHGCQPNLEVRKMQTIGDGSEEFEIGMWAMRDIKCGEELFYDYNFDSFSIEVKKNQRQKCLCGAPNCIGFLGRKQGEKSARELAAEIEAKEAAAEFYMNESDDEPMDEPMNGQSSRGKEVDRSAAPVAADPAAAASSAAITPKRGRPKKAQKISGATSAPTAPQPIAPAPPAGAAGDAPIAVPPATGEPPKKKRGRPPKPRPEGWQLIKRPRGRPRIHPLPDPALPIVKRPRGRPRKKPLKGEAGIRGIGIRSNSVADSGSEGEASAGYSPVVGPSSLGVAMAPAAAAVSSSASPPVAHAAAPPPKSFYWKSAVPSSSSSQAAAAPKEPAESAQDVHMASAQDGPTAPAQEVPKAPTPKVTMAPKATPKPPAATKAAPKAPAPMAALPAAPEAAPAKAADEPSTSNGTAEPVSYASALAGPSRIKLNIGGRDAAAPYPKRSPSRTTAPNGSAEASSSAALAPAVVKRKPGRPPKKQRGPPSRNAPLVAAAMASEPTPELPPPPPPAPTGPKWATAPAPPTAPTYAAAVAGHADPPATPAASSTSAFAVGASAVPVLLTSEGTPAKQTPKQLQKAKRNGAPAGWAYEVVPVIPAADGAGVAPVDDGADDGRRSRRTSRRID